MKRSINLNVLAFMLVVFMLACKAQPSSDDQIHFGEKIEADGAESFSSVMAKLDDVEEYQTKVTGTVQSVCKKKGCWVKLNEADSGLEDMFVKFKDYGFFLPLDCEGAKVVMEGKAFKEITTIDELRHYAEDNGDSEEQIAMITQPKVEYKFLASGVKMIK